MIQTVNWGDESTFSFCFEGIEKGSVVAVSTYMVSAHGNHEDQKEFFLTGYNEMLRRVEPEKIICYHEPFPEMRGDIVFVDYELSSWRHMNDDESTPSKYAKYICGASPVPEGCNLLIKAGVIWPEENYIKGTGRSGGGRWRPHPDKPNDGRLLGKPGEIKVTTLPNGNRYLTKIGPDGRAVLERHFTDHGNPGAHSIPHDHIIDWGSRGPVFGDQINYFDGIVPEFKSYRGLEEAMGREIIIPPDTNMDFESISEFKWSMKCGGEVEFAWGGKDYSVTRFEGKIYLTEAYKEDTMKIYTDVDEALEYMIDGERLRDIITRVRVTNRTM